MVDIRERYSRAYSRLCHFVALRSGSSALEPVQDALIRTAIHLGANSAVPDLIELGERLRVYFSLDFDPRETKYNHRDFWGLTRQKYAKLACKRMFNPTGFA